MPQAQFLVTLGLDAANAARPQRVAKALATLIDWVRTEDVEGCECLTLDAVEVDSVEPVVASSTGVAALTAALTQVQAQFKPGGANASRRKR